MHFKPRRGQADAPIELLVAVIILSMSMALAFAVINQSNQTQCLAELKSKTRELQAAMVDVSLASPPTSREVTFTLPSCPGEKFVGLRVARYNNPDYCTSCPGRYGGCWKIEPLYVERTGDRVYVSSDASICAEISGGVGIEDEYAPGSTTGQSSNAYCSPLSFNSCPATPDMTGGNAQNPLCASENANACSDTSGNLCRTIGSKDSQTYVIRLTKRTYLGGSSGGAAELAYIGVCAMTPQNYDLLNSGKGVG